jgi:hypothetical protein
VLYAWLYVSSEVWLWASCIKLFLTEHDAQYGVRHTRRARCVQLSCFSVLIPIARGRGARRASAFRRRHPCRVPRPGAGLFIAGYTSRTARISIVYPGVVHAPVVAPPSTLRLCPTCLRSMPESVQPDSMQPINIILEK